MRAVWTSKGKKLHTRNVTVTTYHYDEQRIVVKGTLKDDRFQEYYSVAGDMVPSGVIHHMSICLLVNCSNLMIEDIDVDLIAAPQEMCLETIGCLDPIKGLTITRGFTAKVKKLAGGERGCTHLLELLLVMAPATYQGVISYRAQKPSSFDPDRARKMLESLIHTCHAWSEDGPFVGRVKKMLNLK